MKKDKIILWTATIIIFLFETVLPGLTFNSELAKQGISHLGFPAYFGMLLVCFKVLGGFALIIPTVPARIKEWAYAGFGFNFISATVAHAAIDGMSFQTFFPLIILAILAISYIYYHKLNSRQPAIA